MGDNDVTGSPTLSLSKSSNSISEFSYNVSESSRNISESPRNFSESSCSASNKILLKKLISNNSLNNINSSIKKLIKEINDNSLYYDKLENNELVLIMINILYNCNKLKHKDHLSINEFILLLRDNIFTNINFTYLKKFKDKNKYVHHKKYERYENYLIYFLYYCLYFYKQNNADDIEKYRIYLIISTFKIYLLEKYKRTSVDL